MTQKLIGTAIALVLVFIPEPITTASGLAILVYIWGGGSK